MMSRVQAVDCFAGSIASIADRQLVMRAVAELWEIPLERVDFFWRMNKPSVKVSLSWPSGGGVTSFQFCGSVLMLFSQPLFGAAGEISSGKSLECAENAQ